MSSPRGVRYEDREKVEQAAAPWTMCIQYSYKIIVLKEEKKDGGDVDTPSHGSLGPHESTGSCGGWFPHALTAPWLKDLSVSSSLRVFLAAGHNAYCKWEQWASVESLIHLIPALKMIGTVIDG